MRNEGIVKLLSICSIVLAACVALNMTVLHVVRRQYAPGVSLAASVFDISGQFHEWAGYLAQWKSLAGENAVLRETAGKYKASEAMLQSLQEENDTLRKAAGLSVKLKRHLVPAGIFEVSLDPTGYHALINKGQKDGLAGGQAVVSPEGVLIGKISAVFPSSSQIMLVADPGFSVTVKVLNGQTSGILRGALSEGMNLELVTQSEEIVEGDSLVTTGNDLIPPGLVVGTVRNVQNNDTQLFKKVKVTPAMDPSQGSVAVVQQ